MDYLLVSVLDDSMGGDPVLSPLFLLPAGTSEVVAQREAEKFWRAVTGMDQDEQLQVTFELGGVPLLQPEE